MGDRRLIIGSDQGKFNFSGVNEVELDSEPSFNDPVMYRRGQKITETGGGGGADSWDHIPTGPGGRRVQMVLTHGEQSEQARGQLGNPMGAWKMQLNDGKGEADSNMKTAFALDAVTGPSTRPGHEGEIIEAFQLGAPQWESLVRQLRALLGSAAAASSRFYSDHGRFCFNVQDDQPEPKIIVYDTHSSADESTWTAVGQMKQVPL